MKVCAAEAILVEVPKNRPFIPTALGIDARPLASSDG